VRRLVLLSLVALVVPALPAAAAEERPRWDTRVFEYLPDGTLNRSWTVPGQDLSEDRGVQVATSDAAGRLVLLEKSTGAVLRLDVTTGSFTPYSHVPDLPACPLAQVAPGCTPNLVDRQGIPNYAAWLPDGSLLVSDYGQAVIWRVPPGGGQATVWFASPMLDGTEFGTTDISLTPSHDALLVSQQSTALDPSLPTNGKLYRLALRPEGTPGALATLWTSRPGDLPDGFGIAESGRIYLANAGLSAQLVVLAPDGRELERFPSVPVTGENGSPVPFDTPSNATFDGTRVLVANLAFTGTAGHHVVLDVETGEPGVPELVPPTAGEAAGRAG
jgi:sugar lactone lactonase YvrE